MLLHKFHICTHLQPVRKKNIAKLLMKAKECLNNLQQWLNYYLIKSKKYSLLKQIILLTFICVLICLDRLLLCRVRPHCIQTVFSWLFLFKCDVIKCILDRCIFSDLTELYFWSQILQWLFCKSYLQSEVTLVSTGAKVSKSLTPSLKNSSKASISFSSSHFLM